MRTESETRKLRKDFEEFIEDNGPDPAWDAIVDTLNWVLGDAKDLSQYDAE